MVGNSPDDYTHAISEETIDQILTDYEGGTTSGGVSESTQRRQFNARLEEFETNLVSDHLSESLKALISQEHYPEIRWFQSDGVIVVHGMIETIDACIFDSHAEEERQQIIPAVEKAHKMEVRKKHPTVESADPVSIPFIITEPADPIEIHFD